MWLYDTTFDKTKELNTVHQLLLQLTFVNITLVCKNSVEFYCVTSSFHRHIMLDRNSSLAVLLQVQNIFQKDQTVVRPHRVEKYNRPGKYFLTSWGESKSEKIQRSDFQIYGHNSKVISRSHNDVAHLHHPSNVLIAYQLPTPFLF